MSKNARAMVLASFAADALALGVHWVYNAPVIDKKYGRVEQYVKPLTSYHKGKGIGDFTHYGDQMLVLLASVPPGSDFDPDGFSKNWREFFKDYTGYFDKATKGTLENYANGKTLETAGSASDDLAGASRISPLVYRFEDDPEAMAGHCRTQTAMTHNHGHVVDAAEFFARTSWRVLNGSTPVDAIRAVLKDHFNNAPFTDWVADGLDSRDMDTRTVIDDFGQACAVEAAFPSTVHLIAKYEKDLKEALVENVMAGGDSAARGMIAGMILGAHLGMDAIPGNWLSELNAHQKILDLL